MHSWSFPACLLLTLMSGGRSGRPSFAQGRPQDVAVATAPPSVTDAPSADDGPSTTLLVGSATTAVEPRFLYPLDDGLLVNSVDEIEVQYESSWADLVLAVTCKGDGVGGTKSFDVALKEESGKYILAPVDSEISISKYPIDCSLVLQDQESVANFAVGPGFKIQSTGGDASIYALQTTRALSGSAASETASGSSASITDAAAAASSGTGRDGSSSGTASADDSTTETGVAGTSSSSSSGDSSGLSPGASAGIAIGVILAVALVAFLLFYVRRTRRRMAAMQNELDHSRQQNATERAYVDDILKVAGKPDTRNGGRVVMADAPNRGSGEWKQFFGSKGLGGKGAAAGTAVKQPSRLANTVVAAPSPSPSPGPYSPGMDSKMGGDAASVVGSTVGLVSNSAK